MDHTHKGKTYWIVGASSGIGAALARELASHGATVAISARSEDSLKKLADDLDGEGHIAAPCDVGDYQSLQSAAERIQQKFTKLDSVIFMAALYTPHDKQAKDIEEIHKILHVNLGGAFNVVDVTRGYFESQGHGQIVLCGSVAGYRGLPYGQPYGCTKAAIINLAESLKNELRPKNIDVKVINPGFVKTPLTDKNSFKMPFIIEAEDAAKALAKGLISSGFEIHFPKTFTYIMKFIRALPTPLYLALAKHIKP